MAKLMAVFVIISFIAYSNAMARNKSEIERVHSHIDKLGNYNFSYKQTDQQERIETGTIKRNEQTGQRELSSIVGSYKYLRPDGFWQIVTYRADKNGFVPSITVTKNEVSHDIPHLLELNVNVPILSSLQNALSTTPPPY